MVAPPVQEPDDEPATARVLLVEDDVELREGLAENLRLNGLVVHEAATGFEFHNALAVTGVDVAIIDINLPDASGFELARTLGEESDRPGIIILTARAGLQDRLRGYGEGADLYMTKPVDNDELVLAVRNLARRIIQFRAQRPRPDAGQSVWKLDVACKVLISPDNKIINLTGKEIMLLEMFEKAADRPLSRSLLASVMGYGAPGPEHRGLDAAMQRLKEKASKAKTELPFLVVRSVGIRFVGNLKKNS
jgi:DNA-binding response OmpR family regulator